ncbi:MAG: Histidine--tRNA ligase, partial [Alphaproteobacteria bacterium MarineAlpha8_Bin1]
MQKLIPKIKGTKDLFGKDIIYHDKVIDCFEKICNFFFYQKISTPIIEHSSTFIKSLGLTSDIISKEMYSFIDKGGDSIVLRPEGTAAVARALISNSLQEEGSKKFYYSGPMFRRERPQKGRFRQ